MHHILRDEHGLLLLREGLTRTLPQEGASLLIPITQDAHALRRSSDTDMVGADEQEAEVEHSMADHSGKKKVVCRLIHQMSKR